MGWVHAEALRRVGVNIVGVCGSSPEKSRAAADKYGLDVAYDSFDKVLADENVQSVHIGTPNRLHFEMAKQALAAGKHVMCEKPLAMTAEESAELVEIASKYPNQAAAVNYNIRHYPLCLQAKELTQQGQVGDVLHVTGSYVQDWLANSTDYNWRVLAEENGELRAVADIGTHWLDLIHAIAGLEVESVCADLLTVHPVRHRPTGEVESFQDATAQQSNTEPVTITTEDYGAILLRFAGGARGCLHVSQVAQGRKNCLRFEIAGSEQTLAWNSEQPNEMWIGHNDRANETLIRDPALLTDRAAAAADYPGGHAEGFPDSFKQCFRTFYSYILANDFSAPKPFPTFADGHREIVLCEAILKSHREQRWVHLAEEGGTL